MFWIFLLAIGGAIAFGIIGAQSVWLQIFGLGFKVAGVVLSVLGLWFVWRYLSKQNQLNRKAICSGQQIPDTGLSFSSASAGGIPSLN